MWLNGPGGQPPHCSSPPMVHPPALMSPSSSPEISVDSPSTSTAANTTPASGTARAMRRSPRLVCVDVLSRDVTFANHPPTTVTSPETPPIAARARLSQVWDRSTGPNSTRVPNTVHAEPETRNQAPQRDHHSRSSSSVQWLIRPTSAVAARRKVPATNPGASAAYGTRTWPTRMKSLVASSHAIAPPTAPATHTV